jgi:hypothetical protein
VERLLEEHLRGAYWVGVHQMTSNFSLQLARYVAVLEEDLGAGILNAVPMDGRYF